MFYGRIGRHQATMSWGTFHMDLPCCGDREIPCGELKTCVPEADIKEK